MTSSYSPAEATVGSQRWPRATRALLIVVLFVHAGFAAAQPFFAGAFLSGSVDAIAVHSIIGNTLPGWCILQIPVTALFWWPGRGPWWPLLATVVLFVAESVQLGTGYAGALAAHIPLGVAIVATTVVMFVWSLVWRPALRGRNRR